MWRCSNLGRLAEEVVGVGRLIKFVQNLSTKAKFI